MSTQTIAGKPVATDQLDVIFKLAGFDQMHDTVRVVESSRLSPDGTFVFLDLAGCKAVSSLDNLKQLSTLTGLSLRGLRVGAYGKATLLPSLAHLTFLEELDLSNMPPDYSDYRDDNAMGGTYDYVPADLSFLEAFPQLRALNISKLFLKDVTFLKNLRSLRVLRAEAVYLPEATRESGEEVFALLQRSGVQVERGDQ